LSASSPLVVPASFAQRRLWFLERLEPGGTAYNMSRAIRLEGRLSTGALQSSLDALVARHETLRTTFRDEDGEPVQVVADAAAACLRQVDVAGEAAPDREARLDALVAEEAHRPFDLSKGPLFRPVLYRLGGDDHLLQLSMHHIVSDGWSLVVLFRDLAALYAELDGGAPARLPDLPIQYADYAEWQREHLQGAVLQERLAYWRRQLEGMETLELPTDRRRPPILGFTGGTQEGLVPPDLAGRLRGLSGQEGATLYMTLLAAFQVLLSRLSGQRDIVVGTPIAGRDRPELEDLVGFLMNNIVLRTELSGDPSFRELLTRVRRTCLAAYEHQEVPFERLVEELRPERDPSRNPLFQVMFNMLNFGDDRRLELPGLEATFTPLAASTSKFDLTLYAKEEAGAIRLTAAYSADLFDGARISVLVEQYVEVLRQAVERPDAPVSRLTLVTDSARHVLPDPRSSLPGNAHGVIHRFSIRGEDRGGIAVLEAHGPWTYRDLEAASGALAHRLRAAGLGKGDTVAVYGHRSGALVVALLGVLRSGAAFTVLDPAHGAARLIECLRQIEPKAWVEIADAPPPEPELARHLDARGWAFRLRLSRRCAELDGAGDIGPLPDVEPWDTAYVAFTSGTTGGVKGIVGDHAPVAHFVDWHVRTFGLSAADRFSMLSGLSHDPLLRDVFTPLRLGATLCIPDPDRLIEPGYLAGWIRREQVTVAHLTPAMAHVLCESVDGEALDSLRYAFVGGDVLTRTVARRLSAAAPALRCVNYYGATETPQAMAWFDATPGLPAEPGGGQVPLGRGIDGAQLLVVNPSGALAGVGELGEICVRSPYLSRGYLGDGALTRERFVANPYRDDPGDRMYRTGDLGRYLPDGNVAFAGRRDSQVKLRGHRVELGAIEAALSRVPGVLQAVVTACGSPEDRRLAAYAVGGGDPRPTSAVVIRCLEQLLPNFMVPRQIVWLESLPLTANGKVDVRALTAPEVPARPATEESSASATEEILAGIWANVLGREVGLDDDFFSLGGHSLLAVQVASQVRRALGVELPLRAIFDFPTVSGLAAQVEGLRRPRDGGAAPDLVRLPRGRDLELSFAQQRMWLLDRIEPVSSAYHMAWAVEIKGPLRLDALSGALEAVVARHEPLRTAFVSVDGHPYQRVLPSVDVRVPMTDLAGDRDTMSRLMAEEVQRPFDLAEGPPFRASTYRLAPDEVVLLWVVHHIAFDGWSMGVFFHELGSAYDALARGEPVDLPELPVQYADFASWQREWLRVGEQDRQLAHWRERLAGAAPSLELPTDGPRPAVESHRGARQWFELPAALADRLAALSRSEGVTLFMTLLAAFKVLLSRYSGQHDLVVGSPMAGRSRPELEGLIGPFVNTLVLRTNLAGEPSFRELLGRVRGTALDAYAHQDVPFERLVEALRPQRDLSRNPVFQVMFTLQNAPLSPLGLGDLQLRRVQVERQTAQLDLSLHVMPTPVGLRAVIEYATDLFEAPTIRRMAGHYRTLLESAVSDPERRIGTLALMSEQETSERASWNATASPVPECCVHEMIRAQARRTPGKVALEHGAHRLSYAELESRSARLASQLRGLGVGPDARVGVFMDRSPDMVVGVLGVLEAGGAYVPLDPSYPDGRLSWMVEDSGLRVVVAQRELANSLPGGIESVVWMDEDWARGTTASRPSRPDDLAYVIYTSGSTGRPKGVMVTHRAVANLLAAMQTWPGIADDDAVLAVTTLSFDIAVLELLLPLTVGAKVVLAGRDESSDGALLARLLETSGATVMQSTPASWRLLLGSGWKGGRLKALCGGEALPRDLAETLAERSGELWNMYGPTETTVWSTCRRVRAPVGRVLIGRPIANTRVYVVDTGLQPVPAGVPGELCIGGTGLARGYLGRPDLTAERFVPDPSGEPGARMYRTGDRARFTPEGELEHLGRDDGQVKLRGFRIELGEVESALREHPGVAQAVCVVVEPGPADKRLVAYCVPAGSGPPGHADLRAHLRRRLPDYMIPQHYVVLDALPLTPNGKVDRKHLPPTAPVATARAGREPASHLERTIAGLWKELLGIDHVGIEDNFFDLGGHSLLAMAFIEKLERATGTRIRPRDVIFQTLVQIAAMCGGPGASPPSKPRRTGVVGALRRLIGSR